MVEKTNYKDRISNIKGRVITEPSKGTIQKVTPVKPKSTDKGEVQLGVFISKELMKKLKMKAIENDLTVKDIVNEILENNV